MKIVLGFLYIERRHNIFIVIIKICSLWKRFIKTLNCHGIVMAIDVKIKYDKCRQIIFFLLKKEIHGNGSLELYIDMVIIKYLYNECRHNIFNVIVKARRPRKRLIRTLN